MAKMNVAVGTVAALCAVAVAALCERRRWAAFFAVACFYQVIVPAAAAQEARAPTVTDRRYNGDSGRYSGANRFTYLEASDPFYPDLSLPRFITPQWVGEKGVDAVVIISIDDLRETAKYEAYLRPILERLKKIDGRAPVSILCNQAPVDDPQFQTWLKEGVSLEVHTLTHPCPLLRESDFAAAERTYFGGIDLLAKIPGNIPVAFRMPCCDSMNSASPRFFAEIFPYKSEGGHQLKIDSSVMCLLTSADPGLPRELVIEPNGTERFRKYFPMELVPPRKVTFERFAGYIENYPYPYRIGGGWEFPCAVPSDWEAFNCHGSKNPKTLEDWKAALDAIVIKQGVMPMVLHPHGWSDPQQIVDLIDYAVAKHGSRVKFLSFPEALKRLEKNVPLGSLIDFSGDGLMDSLSFGSRPRSYLWNRAETAWKEMQVEPRVLGEAGMLHGGAYLAVMESGGGATLFTASGNFFQFRDIKWTREVALRNGLSPALFNESKIRFRDCDNDGVSELFVERGGRIHIYQWLKGERRWELAKLFFPEDVSLTGLRFIDLNGDGFDDIFFSNAEWFAIYLWAKNVRPDLGWLPGWSHLVRAGKRTGAANEPPPLVRSGGHPNNGAWFRDGHLIIQNEDTAKLEGVVDRRSFKELIAFDVPPPKSPEAALESFRPRPGFKVELVAAEPLVIDPVAFEWDARGRLWVVEMRDYPLGIDGKRKAGGVIKILEDADGDGRYERATPFLDGIPFPTGVMPWRNGALIAAAPDIFYAEDEDGDGRAEVRRTVLTGFTPGNQQHRFNGFEYALDNWVYGANGDSGGTIRSVSRDQRVKISGQDFRFRPDSGDVEAIEGQTQFGRRCDDWGNWFGNNNPTWLWHYPIPSRYVARNPELAVKSFREMLANYPDSTRVFAQSVPPIRFNQPQSLNHVTSACSPAPYRDELFGAEFATSIFISEPVHNVVHREVLRQNGVTFTSERAKDERESEFLASSDNWFRPTMIKTGPDGALYIADMYRFVLEHPEWIAPEALSRLDLRAGDDKGRIYRVVPENKARRAIPNLAARDTAALVQSLRSVNGWERTTAQRLLVERRDKSAVPLLGEIVRTALEPKARMHALCTLEGVGAITAEDVVAGARDSHAAVREHAVRLAEPFLEKNVEKVREALASLVDDPEIRVRYQLAFSLGASPRKERAELLARIALRDGNVAQIRTAIISSASGQTIELLERMLSEPAVELEPELPSTLFRMLAKERDPLALARPFAQLESITKSKPAPWHFVAAAAFLDGLNQQKRNIDQLRATEEGRGVAEALDKLIGRAREAQAANAGNGSSKVALAALSLLGRDSGHRKDDLRLLGDLLEPQRTREMHTAALARLTRIGSLDAAERMIAGWKGHAPNLREEIIGVLLTRLEWSGALMDAIEAKTIGATEIGAAHREALLKHRDKSVAARASRLFAPAESNRTKIVGRYLAGATTAGSETNGREIYRAQCMLCHRFKGEGNEVGPNLEMLAGKPLEELLVGILDPNAAMESRYLAYTASTKDGRTLAGIITAETANSLTLRGPGGAEETVLRSDLQELVGSNRSLMPEGLEQVITVEQMRDLVSYLRAAP